MLFRRFTVLAVAVWVGTTMASAEQPPPPARLAPYGLDLDKMPWKKDPRGGPIDRATLVGDRSKPGLYIQLVRWPPHTVNKAHSHPDDRYGLVVQGTFYHGYGDKYDENALEARPAGSFFTEPARLRHFGVTKEEGAILYFVGTGPSTNDDLEK